MTDTEPPNSTRPTTSVSPTSFIVLTQIVTVIVASITGYFSARQATEAANVEVIKLAVKVLESRDDREALEGWAIGALSAYTNVPVKRENIPAIIQTLEEDRKSGVLPSEGSEGLLPIDLLPPPTENPDGTWDDSGWIDGGKEHVGAWLATVNSRVEAELFQALFAEGVEASGRIAMADPKTGVLTLEDGTTFEVIEGVPLDGLAPGTQVTVSYGEQGGKNFATAIAPVQ